jgi:2EXR family
MANTVESLGMTDAMSSSPSITAPMNALQPATVLAPDDATVANLVPLYSPASGSPSVGTAARDRVATADFERLTSFTLFPKLPPEMSDKIWEFAAFLQRDLPIFITAVGEKRLENASVGALQLPDYQIISSQPAPALLHACREARLVGLKYYKLIFSIPYEVNNLRYSTTPKIYFNTEADRLCIFGPFPCEALHKISEAIVSHKIRKLALNSCMWWSADPETKKIPEIGWWSFLREYRLRIWLCLDIREVVFYWSEEIVQQGDKIRLIKDDGMEMRGRGQTKEVRDRAAEHVRKKKILECQKRRKESGNPAAEIITDAELAEISGPVFKIVTLEVSKS